MRPPNTRVEEYVQKNWKKKTVSMMAEESNSTIHAVSAICQKLGITPITTKDLKIAAILDNPGMGTGQLAKLLGCTIQNVSLLKREIESGAAFRDSEEEINAYLASRVPVKSSMPFPRLFHIDFSMTDYRIITNTNCYLK